MDYDFHKYVCEVTGLTCCGCSLFCGNRKDKTDDEADEQPQ